MAGNGISPLRLHLYALCATLSIVAISLIGALLCTAATYYPAAWLSVAFWAVVAWRLIRSIALWPQRWRNDEASE